MDSYLQTVRTITRVSSLRLTKVFVMKRKVAKQTWRSEILYLSAFDLFCKIFALLFALFLSGNFSFLVRSNHRRRMETEEKVKVVSSVWGAKFIKFPAALAD